jgi:uncharacterized membrane protein
MRDSLATIEKTFYMQQTQETSNEADPIGENIQTIAELHKRAERGISPQQRGIERVTNFLGRPRFLFIILVVVLVWILINIVQMLSGLQVFDAPPFNWLQGALTLGALLQATLILITQNRQDIMMERRTQLDLEVSLLLDQKMSKLITMVDDLRRVHPALEDGTDPQVEALKRTVDPHETLETLDQLLSDNEKKE